MILELIETIGEKKERAKVSVLTMASKLPGIMDNEIVKIPITFYYLFFGL